MDIMQRFGEDEAKQILAYHRTMPEYKATPLRVLDQVTMMRTETKMRVFCYSAGEQAGHRQAVGEGRVLQVQPQGFQGEKFPLSYLFSPRLLGPATPLPDL